MLHGPAHLNGASAMEAARMSPASNCDQDGKSAAQFAICRAIRVMLSLRAIDRRSPPHDH